MKTKKKVKKNHPWRGILNPPKPLCLNIGDVKSKQAKYMHNVVKERMYEHSLLGLRY